MNSEQRALLDLNDDCLRHIVSYLNQLDKLNLCLISNRFANILAETLTKNVFDMFVIQYNFTRKEAEILLSQLGSRITKLIFGRSDLEAIDTELDRLISIYCLNLEEVELYRTDVASSKILSAISLNQLNINKLTLRCCEMSAAGCLLVSQLSKLRILNITRCTCNGDHLSSLTKLCELDLTDCFHMKKGNFVKLCRAVTLKSLNISGCSDLTHDAFDAISATQPNLERLVAGKRYMTYCNKRGRFGLKRLKEIVFSFSGLGDGFADFNNYLRKQESVLECIDIEFHLNYKTAIHELCRTISNKFDALKVICLTNTISVRSEQLQMIINGCPKLEMVDLSATLMDDDGIILLANGLKCLKFLDISYCSETTFLYRKLVEIWMNDSREHLLTIHINEESTLNSLFKHQFYHSHKLIVKLTREHMRSDENDGMLKRLVSLNEKTESRKRYKMPTLQEVLTERMTMSKMERFLDYDEALQTVLTERMASLMERFLDYDEAVLKQAISRLEVEDKLRLAMYHNRYAELLSDFFKDNVFILYKIALYSDKQRRLILSRCAPFIKRISLVQEKFPDGRNESCYYFYFRNLEELHLVSFAELDEGLRVMSSSSESLKAFSFATYENHSSEQLQIEISKLSNLTTLHLLHFKGSGEHLGKLRNLKELNLFSSDNIEPKYFMEICRANKLLTLDIEKCKKLNNPAFRVLAETQTHLQRIVMGPVYRANNSEIVAKLPKIMSVRLSANAFKNLQKHLSAFAEYRSDDLKVLEIDDYLEQKSQKWQSCLEYLKHFKNLVDLRLKHYGFSEIRNEKLIQVLKCLSKLEIVDLSRKKDMSEELLLALVKELPNLRHFHIHIEVGNSYKFYQDLIQIIKQKSAPLPITIHLYGKKTAWESELLQIINTKQYLSTMQYLILTNEELNEPDFPHGPRKITEVSNKNKIQKDDVFDAQIQSDFAISELTDLPTDFLKRLALYLRPLDKIKLLLLHRRFRDLKEYFLSVELFDINEISENLTVAETETLLANLGQHVRRIRYENRLDSKPVGYMTLVEPFKDFFTEIEIQTTDSHSSQGFHDNVIQMFSPAQRLKKISLTLSGNAELFNKILKIVNPIELQTLHINSDEFVGHFINRFQNLIKIDFNNCKKLRGSNLIGILKKTKLKYLDIRQCEQVNEKAFDVLFETQTELEHLLFTFSSSVCKRSIFCRQKKLKHLTVEYEFMYYPKEWFMDDLILDRRNDLVSLELINNVGFREGCFRLIMEKRIERFRKLTKLKICQKNGVDPDTEWDSE